MKIRLDREKNFERLNYFSTFIVFKRYGISPVSLASQRSQLLTVEKVYTSNVCLLSLYPRCTLVLPFAEVSDHVDVFQVFLFVHFKFAVFWGAYIETIAMLLVVISALFVNLYLVVLIALRCFIL